MKRASVKFAVIVLATVATVAVTASLGFWQLSRADEKRTLEEQIDSRAQQAPWRMQDLLAAHDLREGHHRPASLTGEWVPGASVFLDNRPMGGRSGFILVTPLRLQGQDATILVQRGWVPRNFVDRTRVPTVDTPTGPVKVQGRLAPPPSHLFELGASETGPIRQNIDLSLFSKETGLHFLAVSLLQTAPADPALERDWPRFAAGAQKHLGYAVQWFAMSTTAVCLFLWFQIISPRRKHRSHGQDSR